ncbi:type I-B CRISPR-associated protein Cas7/Csh2 [Mariniphaga sediminis]|uniref:Type I-B CRISPR-associated protein Cas7/Csh2 n=1 Tax=Mariniphaga sediminis TaxID=1628158 RepID=A0A399D6B4_9BACT|nr:type I-B CRISPR-associated protein Cas7/Csh2 [Mariniphaga sediminis]RIH67159.1 type I-B CRISPR-associated protein Cas7/Csh2 [Mariniphaga sediminis]
MTTVNHNSDFIFLYDATLCNPNGDPDQENKPRMDYDTNTNLVTDTRVKRFIRDYLKDQGQDIFVDMEGDSKVSSDTKLEYVIERVLSNENERAVLFEETPDLLKDFIEIIAEKKGKDTILKLLQNKKNSKLNYYILSQLVKDKFIDIRMFGSAFAVGGFTKAYTGAIQMNWGYSLNQVELVESNSIVTIMNDDSSTFGKDYRVYYSLLAFNGTINKYAAKATGLTEEDQKLFRKAIWESIPSQPTRSKMNQYPKLYLEIIYNEGFNNGHFGDLRNTIKVSYKEDIPAKQVRTFNDLIFDVSGLAEMIIENKGEGKPISEVIIYKSADFPELKIN